MRHTVIIVLVIFALVQGAVCMAQSVVLRDAPAMRMPGSVDSNNAAHWDGDTFYLFNSGGKPTRNKGCDQFNFYEKKIPTAYNNQISGKRWIECTWRADDGTLYGWYHNEPWIPETRFTAPRIGAAKSTNNGLDWIDLGLVLEARPNTIDRDYKNGFFVGGNGDFSAMLDKDGKYLYLFFSTYAGDVSEQGVAVARMYWKDRDNPVGKVHKYHKGKWNEPGVGGFLTPIFPAKISWKEENADAFWGPSIHWNTYLKKYVILLNRTAYKPGWPQEGIYITYGSNLGDPKTWTEPKKIFDKGGWYPQIIGVNSKAKETDKLCGKQARFYMHGFSDREIIFFKEGEDTSVIPPVYVPENVKTP